MAPTRPLRDLYQKGSAQRTKKEVVVCMSCCCCCCTPSPVLHGIHEVLKLTSPPGTLSPYEAVDFSVILVGVFFPAMVNLMNQPAVEEKVSNWRSRDFFYADDPHQDPSYFSLSASVEVDSVVVPEPLHPLTLPPPPRSLSSEIPTSRLELLPRRIGSAALAASVWRSHESLNGGASAKISLLHQWFVCCHSSLLSALSVRERLPCRPPECGVEQQFWPPIIVSG